MNEQEVNVKTTNKKLNTNIILTILQINKLNLN